MQRVFVRGVTNDALSADVAHWALQKLNNTDTNFEIGLVEGRNVTTIATEREEKFMDDLVEYIMQGPESGSMGDNFLFKPYPESPFVEPKTKWYTKLRERIEDMASGLGAIPRWLKASAEYRLEYAIDDIKDEQILYDAIPRKFAPKLKVKPIDILIASLKPRDPLKASAGLWRHLRESLSAAIDAPTSQHPSVLIDKKDNRLLVFSRVDRVLPDPETSWSGEKFSSGTSVRLEPIGWLDASKAHETSLQLRKRLEELAPGLVEAREQLSETQKFTDEAEKDLRSVSEELALIEKELESDVEAAKRVSESHTHKLPSKVTGPAKRPRGNIRKIAKSKSSGDLNTDTGGLANQAKLEENNKEKKSFWKRLFKRRGASK